MEDNLNKATSYFETLCTLSNKQAMVNCMALLVKLFGNILNNPKEAKFRKISGTAQKLKDYLFNVAGIQTV